MPQNNYSNLNPTPKASPQSGERYITVNNDVSAKTNISKHKGMIKGEINSSKTKFTL